MVDVSSSNFVIEINVLFLFGKMLSVKYVPHFPTSPMLENYNYPTPVEIFLIVILVELEKKYNIFL